MEAWKTKGNMSSKNNLNLSKKPSLSQQEQICNGICAAFVWNPSQARFLWRDSDTLWESLTDYAKIYFLTLQNKKSLVNSFGMGP